MSTLLTDAERTTVRACHYRLITHQGKTYVDGNLTDEDNTVFWFDYASGASTIGLVRTRAMIEVYKRHANNDQPKEVFILMKNTPCGTMTSSENTDDSL